MYCNRKILKRVVRRKLRVRSRLSLNYPRVTIFRSLSNIYAQLIDDKNAHTVASFSSLNLSKDLKNGKTKKDIAYLVGKELAKLAIKNGIKKAVYDRGQFLYHGRVAALAQGLKEGGLEI